VINVDVNDIKLVKKKNKAVYKPKWTHHYDAGF